MADATAVRRKMWKRIVLVLDLWVDALYFSASNKSMCKSHKKCDYSRISRLRVASERKPVN